MLTAPATMIASTKAALTTIDERLTSSCTCGKPVTSGEVKNAAVRNETSPPSMPWTRSASHSMTPLRSQSAMVVYPPRMPWRTSRITGARTARAYPASAALKLPLACSAWAGSPPAVMYRRPPTTRNRVATAARIPMIHTLRPSMTSGMVFAARTSGAGAAAIRSPAAETMVYAYMSGLHEGRWAAFGGEPRDVLAGGGAPPYVVCEGWWSVRPYRVPASRPRGAHPHRGGHAISGMHPPRPTLSGQTNSPPTCPDLTAPNDAGHSSKVAPGVPELVEQDRYEERHRVPEHQRETGEVDRVLPRGGEARVGDDAVVVVPTNPGGDASPGPLEAHDDAADHRVPGEEREAQHGADEEGVPGEVVPHLAAATGPRTAHGRRRGFCPCAWDRDDCHRHSWIGGERGAGAPAPRTAGSALGQELVHLVLGCLEQGVDVRGRVGEHR